MLLYAMAQSLSHLIVHAVFSTFLSQRVERRGRYRLHFDQAEHHRKFSYQEELRELLKRHRVAFDERYLWK